MVVLWVAMRIGRSRKLWLNANSSLGPRRLPLHLRISSSLAHKIVLSNILHKFGSRLRFCTSGGAPLSNNIFIPILEGYNLSETSPLMV
jgi:long-subunit acyl-CoA synthetase (AMP-forming)